MSPRSRKPPESPLEAQLAEVALRLDEVAKLLTILIGRERSLQDVIGDLSKVGLGPTRIAELVGTTHGYAKVAVDRAKKRKAAAPRNNG